MLHLVNSTILNCGEFPFRTHNLLEALLSKSPKNIKALEIKNKKTALSSYQFALEDIAQSLANTLSLNLILIMDFALLAIHASTFRFSKTNENSLHLLVSQLITITDINLSMQNNDYKKQVLFIKIPTD